MNQDAMTRKESVYTSSRNANVWKCPTYPKLMSVFYISIFSSLIASRRAIVWFAMVASDVRFYFGYGSGSSLSGNQNRWNLTFPLGEGHNQISLAIEDPNSMMLWTGYCRNFIGFVIALGRCLCPHLLHLAQCILNLWAQSQVCHSVVFC